MDKPIRVLLADDHAILRDGIKALLNDETDIDVVGEAGDGRRAVELASALEPDVVLMDIAMPLLNGLEASRQIRRTLAATYVLILTMHHNEEYIPRVLEAGASGYVLKHAAGHELVAAIRAVAAGGAFFSPAIARSLADAYVQQMTSEQSYDESEELTSREREILQLVAEGYTNREIGEMLHISSKTVKTHRFNLMQKLGLHSRGELVQYALHKGIITES